MSRIIRCVKPMHGQYITVGEDYTYTIHDGEVSYSRVSNGSGSFMPYEAFKRALQRGEIVFVDNL